MGKIRWSEESGMAAFSSQESFLSGLVTQKDNSRLATEPTNGSLALQAYERTALSGGDGTRLMATDAVHSESAASSDPTDWINKPTAASSFPSAAAAARLCSAASVRTLTRCSSVPSGLFFPTPTAPLFVQWSGRLPHLWNVCGLQWS